MSDVLQKIQPHDRNTRESFIAECSQALADAPAVCKGLIFLTPRIHVESVSGIEHAHSRRSHIGDAVIRITPEDAQRRIVPLADGEIVNWPLLHEVLHHAVRLGRLHKALMKYMTVHMIGRLAVFQHAMEGEDVFGVFREDLVMALEQAEDAPAVWFYHVQSALSSDMQGFRAVDYRTGQPVNVSWDARQILGKIQAALEFAQFAGALAREAA